MRRPFLALIWKEALETSRYSAPAVLLFAVFMHASVRPATSLQGVVDPVGHFSWFGLMTAFVATVIGVSQTFRESRGDAWGFAMHRPVSRNAVMLAKVLVGSVSVIVVAGIPYALAMIWLSIPGHRAVPFDIHFVLPGLGDLLAGLTFYAAGLLAGARRFPMVTRATGFGLAIVTSLAASGVVRFTTAAAMMLAATTILLAAAWSSFTHGSDYDDERWWGRAANTMAAAPGVMLGATIVMTIALWFIPSGSPEVHAPVKRPEVTITREGRIALLSLGQRDQITGERKIIQMTDLEGRSIPRVTDSLSEYPSTGMISTSAISADISFDLANIGRPSYRNTRTWVTRLFPTADGPVWYFERASGQISLYDEHTRRVIGWLSPAGYSDYPNRPAGRFPGYFREENNRGQGTYGTLVFSGGVYRVRGLERPKEIFLTPQGETAVSATEGGMYGKILPRTGGWGFYNVVTTDKHTYVVSEMSRQVEIAAPMDTTIRVGRMVRVTRAFTIPGAPTFVWYHPMAQFGADTVNRILEYREGSAEPVARYTVAGTPFQSVYSAPGGSFAAAGVEMSAVGGPSLVFPGMQIYTAVTANDGSRIPTTALAITIVISIISVLIVGWLARRYAFSRNRTVIWMILAAVSGPVALLTMWLLFEWPARERCPSCGKLRVVNRDRCEHCSAEFAPPARDGTELLLAS